jgi:phosphatidate phosphatase PAH1
MAEDLMAKLTGKQTGGAMVPKLDENNNPVMDENNNPVMVDDGLGGGRRRRRHSKGHKGNSWLAHVKATMKLHPGKSFKQILKIAKKTYKKSQSRSQSQSGGKRRQNQKSQKSQKKYQNGGSGGKMAGLGESAAPYV